MDKRLVNVPVATVWTSHNSARELDVAAISNPVDIDRWLEGLTFETRLGLCEQNLVQTQLLYGEEVVVIEEIENWVHVIIPDQPTSKNVKGYPGWVPSSQLVKCPLDWNIKEGPVVVVTNPKTVLYKETKMELSYQTILPLIKEADGKVIVKTPDGTGLLSSEHVTLSESLTNRFKGNGTEIVSDGEKFLNLPYLWGGMSSYGYDCSGFSYTMCKANGYIIPRDAHDQANAGEQVSTEEIKPGDLLFFAYEEGKGRIHHVGIYYGDGKLLHSPNTGKTVEIISLAGTIYERELCAARRYWVETEA
ncbi:C40 family peptidase [Neobacillus niacini]|uniref:C40 family peptidase n=1 Tax=Neobacillus niacini TaxID=86668 RepID=UPI0005F0A977|nr:C40 family peptidase [Neobacillus niacini]